MGINDILAAIDNMKRVGARNIGDLGRDPIGALSKIAHNVKEQLGTEGGAKEFMYNSMVPGVGGIIKSKGGNWLTGSVEDALKGLIPKAGAMDRSAVSVMDEMNRVYPSESLSMMSPETRAQVDRALNMLKPKVALQNWIEGPLTKYVKRDMATEGDPVRKLAEQGVLHFDPATQPPGVSGGIPHTRQQGGFPMWGTAKSDLAKRWEDLSDSTVSPRKVSEQLRAEPPWNAEGFPWLEKLDPNETIFHTSRDMKPERLGFNHLTDELSNALNPESGLPRHLQLTPEQMQQMGMEKAVRHVADINAWRAAQQAEANLAKSQSPAVHMVREYAENNPKGLRWTELRQPEAKLGEGWKVIPQGDTGLFEVVDDIGRQRSVGASEKEAINLLNHKERQQLLADQLKYEGDTMGHCVGGYCDDVAGGRSRIFSLRDAKGEPHVTIETAPPKDLNMRERFLQRIQSEGASQEEAERQASKLFTNLDPTIKQIKGKQNRKPNDEYLPFVQDFVRNHPEGGKWGDVGDLQNTGLIDRLSLPGNRITSETPQWLTPDEVRVMGEDPDKLFRNFAEGGVVQAEQSWQPFAGGYILR